MTIKRLSEKLPSAPANLPVGFVPALGTVDSKPNPTRADIKQIASVLFWWISPDEALSNPRRFLAQVMTLGTWDDLQIVKKVYDWDAFRDALLSAEVGWFDARSWDLWHHAFKLDVTPMPKRSLT
jgi:hypothetical protein